MHRDEGGFYVRKAQFKKPGILPTLGLATSQEAFMKASSKIAYPKAKENLPHS